MRALVLLALAAPLAAQPTLPVDRRAPLLARQGPTIVAEPVALTLAGFDADQDGLVTRAEVAAGAARSFAAVARGAIDLGYIGFGDWAVRWLGDANALPSPYEVDGDRNDRITAGEIAAALDAAFVRFDLNHDNTLSRAELVTIRATMFGNERGESGKGKPPKRP